MKHYLSLLFLFCLGSLFGQGLDCSVEVNPGGKICYDSPMCLTATTSPTFNTPPNSHWSYVSGPVAPSAIGFVDANAFSTCVINNSGSPTWLPGPYTFEFCVDCRETNPDGSHDRPCTQTTVTVTPEPTAPVIIELDGAQDGHIHGCDQVTFNVNSLSIQPGELVSIVPVPNNGGVTIVNNAGVVTVRAHDFGALCNYSIIYSISNGGCVRSTSVAIDFVIPFDPNNDGIIEGTIENCPSCTKTVNLNGHFPGCGATAVWTVQPGSAGTAIITPGAYNGSAIATVSSPGHYIFGYTVTNIAPCPDSYFELECDILDIDSFDLGPDQNHYICGNIIPPGTAYAACFNDLDNVIYTWTPTNTANFQVNPTPGQEFCAAIFFPNGYNLSVPLSPIRLRAWRYYIDKDCEGPDLPMVVELPPGNTNQQNIDFIKKSLANAEGCIDSCYNDAFVGFYGSPNVQVNTSDVSFLCSTGSETVRLANYFNITNGVSAIANATVLSQPSCGNLSSFPFSAYQLLQLDVTQCGNCGVFEFKIDVITFDPILQVATPCTTTIYLTIRIETAKEVDAGTDQIKCPGDEILLHASNPYCTAEGTWTRVNCTGNNYYTVNLGDIHDPLMEIDIIDPVSDTICPPDTLCFVWSFTSNSGQCDLSDTTRVYIRDSCCFVEPCAQNLHVSTECVEGHVTLTLLSNQGVLNPNEYTIIWTPGGQGNPVNILLPPNGTVYYNVQVFKVVGNDTICYAVLSGSANCPVEGCGAHVVESCGPNGNIILTLVNGQGNIILPSTYDEIFWSVYANGNSSYSVNLQNPITIQQDACYSVRYQHIIPPHILECVFNFPKTCPTITCPGPCENFNDFFVAGCGDNLDISLNLTFPPGCQSFCGSQGTSGMLGVFRKSTNQPVNPAQFNITWGSTNFHGTYATGNLNQILPVTIVTTAPDCFWKSGYVPQCCPTPTPYIECQQPIVKYCRPDGTFYYIVGAPQIFWTPVPGATGYNILVITGGIEGCCSGTSVVWPPQTVYTNIWSIPPGLNCFTIRVQAIIPGCPEPGPTWSNTYVYCPQEVVCNPVITVCGCCSGNYRSEEMSGLPTTIVSEEEVLAIIKANPGSEYVTLRDALNAAGTNVKAELEFNVFPNPASDQIVIKAGNTVKGTFKVQVTDLLQREWRNEAFDAAGEKTLNISDLPNGIYLVTIRNARGDQMMTEKIVVMK